MDNTAVFRNEFAQEREQIQGDLQAITQIRSEHAPYVLRCMARSFARRRSEYRCHSQGDCGYIAKFGIWGTTIKIPQYDAAGRLTSLRSTSITNRPPPEEDAKFFAHFLETHSDGMAKCSYQMDKEDFTVICQRIQQ